MNSQHPEVWHHVGRCRIGIFDALGPDAAWGSERVRDRTKKDACVAGVKKFLLRSLLRLVSLLRIRFSHRKRDQVCRGHEP